MADTPMQTVNWKFPTRIAYENAGDWTPLREHLSAWADSGEPLEVDPDTIASVCFRLPEHVLEALNKEAQRLTELHGRRYTAGMVARLIWDTWDAPSNSKET